MFNALAQQFKAEQPAQEAQQNNADMVARRKERRRERKGCGEREREKRVRSFFEVFFPFLSFLEDQIMYFCTGTTLPIINLCSMPPRDSTSAITLIRLLPLSLFLGRPNQVFLVGTTLPIKIYVLRLRAILSLLLLLITFFVTTNLR